MVKIVKHEEFLVRDEFEEEVIYLVENAISGNGSSSELEDFIESYGPLARDVARNYFDEQIRYNDQAQGRDTKRLLMSMIFPLTGLVGLSYAGANDFSDESIRCLGFTSLASYVIPLVYYSFGMEKKGNLMERYGGLREGLLSESE